MSFVSWHVILLLYLSLLVRLKEISFFLLDRVLTPVNLCIFQSLKFGIWDSWNMCSNTFMCLFSFNFNILPPHVKCWFLNINFLLVKSTSKSFILKDL